MLAMLAIRAIFHTGAALYQKNAGFDKDAQDLIGGGRERSGHRMAFLPRRARRNLPPESAVAANLELDGERQEIDPLDDDASAAEPFGVALNGRPNDRRGRSNEGSTFGNHSWP